MLSEKLDKSENKSFKTTKIISFSGKMYKIQIKLSWFKEELNVKIPLHLFSSDNIKENKFPAKMKYLNSCSMKNMNSVLTCHAVFPF